jgi:hypothetical protein
MDLLMVRHQRNLALVPATDLDRDRLSRLPKGFPMEVRTRHHRTSKLNRWYRGLVGHVAEAIGVDPDTLHLDLKIKAKLIERVLVSGEFGGVIIVPRSTEFATMDDDEFAEYVDLAVELLFRDYLGKVTARDKARLINEWAGRRPALEAPPRLLKLPSR